MSRLLWRSTLILAALTAAGCGPVEQDAACIPYVACVQAVDVVQGNLTDLSSYGETGACWQNADNADVCAAACSNGLDWIRDVQAQLPAECTG